MRLTGSYTTAGAAMTAQALAAGSGLTITRVEAGAGTTTADAAALAEVRQTPVLMRKQAENGACVLEVLLNSSDAQAQYTLWELGVYARLGNGTEQLYQIFRLDEGLNIEPQVDLGITFYLAEQILPAETVQVVLAQEGYITAESCGNAIAEASAGSAAALSAHETASNAHQALFNAKANASHTHSAGNITAGTFGGRMAAPADTAYTTGQVRNIVLSTANPSGGSNGWIWLKYEA